MSEQPDRQIGFGTRLILAMSAVLAVGVVTAWVVASAVGPTIFRDHFAQSGESDPHVIEHAELAYRTAGVLTVAIAAAAMIAACLVVGVLLSKRVSRTLGNATDVAATVAHGDYAGRMPDPKLGREFASWADSFNAMAADLEGVERTRRSTLSDLAHELRTPIAALRGYHEALADGVRQPDRQTMALLARHTDRLSRLADDIRQVTAAEEGRLAMAPTPVRLADIARAACADVRGRADGLGISITVEAAGAAQDAAILGDAVRLGQVVGNLLDNALKHTTSGGNITVSIWCDAKHVSLSVADDGDGIDKEHLPYLFDRFYRVDSARDRTHGGSGIGLAIVKAIVSEHGGRVTAQSDGEGHGARFVVELPATTAR
jgi:signal transduction histidine kinase